ncbi:helix-turn-helix domain-containing protein [Roseburia faecis]
MDQVKIEKFISDERKAKGYTQKQLSELLGISDKTISKWECGVSHS